MNLLPETAPRRNTDHHHLALALDPSLLTRGGRLIHQRTRRPISTCNAIAEIVGIGVSVTER